MKKKFIWLLFLLLIITSALWVTSPYVAEAKTTQELEAEIRDLDTQIDRYSQRIAANKKKKNRQQEYLNDLQKKADVIEKKSNALQMQILTVEHKIEEYNNRIRQLKNEMLVIKDEIALISTQIKATSESIEKTKSALQSRLRTAYIHGNEPNLKILMGADNLATFLTRLEMMKRSSEKDNQAIHAFAALVSDLKDARKVLVEKQNILEEKTQELHEAREDLISRKKELLKKQQEYDTVVAQLQKESKKIEIFLDSLSQNSDLYQSYINQLRKERDAADKEIDEIIKALVTTTVPASQSAPSTTDDTNLPTSQPAVLPSAATWLWPVGSPCYISSGFGPRDPRIGGYAFHGGIDIADPNGSGVIYGRPICASRGGTVVTAIWGTTGYGNYVILDHGDGYTTVYGHCSSLSVRAGQTVVQGQQIGNVGESGNAKGAHLHFEVRYNGVKQNPLNYVRSS